jgi:hypothetical protein
MTMPGELKLFPAMAAKKRAASTQCEWLLQTISATPASSRKKARCRKINRSLCSNEQVFFRQSYGVTQHYTNTTRKWLTRTAAQQFARLFALKARGENLKRERNQRTRSFVVMHGLPRKKNLEASW